MRPIELFLTVVCTAVFVQMARGLRIQTNAWLRAALAVVLAIQLMAEGWRWQMAPAYVAMIVALGAMALSVPRNPRALFGGSIVNLGLLGLSVLICLVLPYRGSLWSSEVFELGVADLPVARVPLPAALEASGDDGLPRVRLWYPSQPPMPRSAWASWLKLRVANGFRAPSPELAIPAAPIVRSNNRFPVLLYFPGWPEDRLQNMALIRGLVGHGFVVASIQYPSRSRGARSMLDYASDAAFERTVELDNELVEAHARTGSGVLDALAVLDQGEPNSPFRNRLDLLRAGVFGFSFGGAVAAELSRIDGRIKAVVNMDGRHWAQALRHGVERPYLFIGEELPMPTAAELESSDAMTRYEARMDQADYSQLAANLRSNGGFRVTIVGTAHLNFTDRALRSPLRRLSGGGTIDARRALLILDSYVLDFFQSQLRGQPSALLAGGSRPFPEAQIQCWPGAAQLQCRPGAALQAQRTGTGS